MDALERQIAEKTKQRHIEAECERKYEEQTQRQQHCVHAKELDEEKRKRIIESDINYYRCRFQRMDQRREFDLNDPNWIKKSQPARVADDDISLGISSAQIFSGEDLGNRERKTRQREQQRAWLDQQVLERKQNEEARRKADRVYQESMESRDKRLEEMTTASRKMKNVIVDSIRNYNCELAKIKKVERQREKKEKDEDDMAEIYNMLTSDMLTENPDVAQSRLYPNKKIAFMYRGMTPEELQKFREDQHRQMVANKKRDTEQQLIDKQWEQYALNMDKELLLKELEMDRKAKADHDIQIRFNADLAIKQKAQKEYNDKKLYVNHMSKEFYDQFNRTSR